MNPGEDRFSAALALHETGALEQAEALYRAAALAGHPAAAANLAVLCLQQTRAQDAVHWAQQAIAAAPASAERRSLLATALQASGRADAAIEVYEEALGLEPELTEAHYGLACALRALGRHDEALACYRRALAIDPDYAEAECMMADLLATLGKFDAAAEACRRALDIDPTYHDARLGLAEALRKSGSAPAAEAEYRAVLEASPDAAEALAGLAKLLLAQDRHDEALALLREAVSRNPDDPEAHRRYGLALAEAGDLDAAAGALDAAIALRPSPAILRERATIRPTRADDPCLAIMRSLAAGADALTDADQVQLHFALGRALADAGDPAAGFDHLRTGNALHRSLIRYDETGTLRLLDQIRQSFPAALMQARSGAGVHSAVPVFIVGMPRSGSTLVEQILASHPAVFGAGEIPAFGDAVHALGCDLPYPELAADLDLADLQRLGRDYLARIGAERRSVARITDKMLANALFVGLIHLALPQARILHVCRDPVDTCLSCFAELFTPDQPFAYDLGELGRFHRVHAQLMAHWRAVLPDEIVLTIRYEALIADFDAVVHGLLRHCGLAWDDRVRRFHDTRRAVRTASLAQVRRPIDQTARGRWRPDDATLRPLLEALAEPDRTLRTE
ncbi:MAG TPA: sulfotransferase [Acetobacteraceae bacterium]|nr:sulfotransferase [Acetobacteraceae bacterium]